VGFLFWDEIEGRLELCARIWPKNMAGEGDHTRVNIARTRQDAQFSLGKANLTHRAGLASDFGKRISIFRIGFVF
jgi:hypothetical protein